MKKINFIAACLLVACGIFVISCNQDGDYDDDFYGLDVIKYTSVAKTAQAEPMGVVQGVNLNGNSNNNYTVPQYENECVLYALISIAAQKNIPITYQEPDGKGGYRQKTEIIGDGFSATRAYNIVKGMATSRSWSPCDVYGNEIPGREQYQYTGGNMAASVAATIGRESGILKGVILYFENFEKLQAYMNQPSFKEEHHDGKCIIFSESAIHATVGKGVDRKGNIKYYDANKSGKYEKEQQTGRWTLIY